MSVGLAVIRIAFAVLGVGLAACSLPESFECSSSSTCNLETGGVCAAAPTGKRWCRYPATVADCASGTRWSIQAGDGLASVCVAADDAGVAPTIDADLTPDAEPTPDAPGEPDAPEPDAAEPDAPVPDAGIPDAPPPPDAPPDAATSGPVMIAAFDKDWKPLVGTPVIASAPDGTLDSETTTNGAGIAMLNVPIGGMVTVANRVADVENLTTITGVKPFDVLTTISLETSRRTGPQIGALTWVMPPLWPGADGYRSASGCQTSLMATGDPPEPVTGIAYRDCVDADRYIDGIAIAEATTATRDKALAFSFIHRYVPPNGGSALGTFPNWTSAHDVEVQVKNIPPGVVSTDFDGYVTYRASSIRTEHETVSTNLYRLGIPSEDPGSSSLRVALGLTFVPAEGDNALVLVRQAIPLESIMPSVDASAAPPALHKLVVSDTDLGRPRFSWQSDATLPTRVTGGYIMMKWDSPGSGKPAVNWTMIIAPATEARAPVLPAVLTALVPLQPPRWQVVMGNTGARVPTYDAFRGSYIPYLDVQTKLFENFTTNGNLFQ